MSITATNTIPIMLEMPGVPGSSIASMNIAQLMFNSSDSDPNASGLYFLKSGSSGSESWLELATVNQITNANTRSATYPTRSLNTAFQPSATTDCLVTYSVDISCSMTLTSGQNGTVTLQICPTSGFSSGVQEICRFVNGNTGTLTIGLSLVQDVTGVVSGFVPAGYYVRLATTNNTGTPTFAFRSGQETLL
jgi:hypothetical protein